MPHLFSPIALRGLTLANRVVVSPMCQYSAVDGSATDWHLMHLGKLAVSGAGLVIIEAAHVEPRGRITHGCLGLYSDANEAALERVVGFCRRQGFAKIGIQLSHAGRKGSTELPWVAREKSLGTEEGGWRTVGCSGQPRAEGWPAPHALDCAGLDAIIEAHAEAVGRARRIGIDLVELNAAHGYLLHEFLSPLSNARRDDFGGTLENRMRFPLAVFEAMRARWPADKPMGVRISATDWIGGGWTPDQSVMFSRALKERGCDYVTASSGGLSLDQRVPLGEGHQVEFAATIRREARIPTMAVGMIYRPEHADEIVASDQADMIAMARGMLFDPHWTWRAAAQLGVDIAHPPQYIRAYRSRWLRGFYRGE